jgi:hypothetical protein
MLVKVIVNHTITKEEACLGLKIILLIFINFYLISILDVVDKKRGHVTRLIFKPGNVALYEIKFKVMTLDLSKIQRKIELGGLELLIRPLLLPSKVALFRHQT